jgi:hypothetical protein
MPYTEPTVVQAKKCIYLCQSLSDLGRDIVLFRFNTESGEIFILTRDEIQIVIQRDGSWEFIV